MVACKLTSKTNDKYGIHTQKMAACEFFSGKCGAILKERCCVASHDNRCASVCSMNGGVRVYTRIRTVTRSSLNGGLLQYTKWERQVPRGLRREKTGACLLLSCAYRNACWPGDVANRIVTDA